VSDELTLRERKQRRNRDAILDAAMALFAERGFDGVTVNDIAARAEVGRTTFFRYFTDKQELLFADDDEIQEALTTAVDDAASRRAPIGDDLATAVGITRIGLRALATVIERRAQWLGLRQQLIDAHPALSARSLVKERGYATAAARLLIKHGSTPSVAVLAVGIAAACYQTAQAEHPDGLGQAIDKAFDRLTELT
jgi:AcrR family transcriptional regulator